MSIIDNNTKEIHFKVIYYGPSGSGKTSSLKFIQEHSLDSAIETFSIPFESPVEGCVICVGDILGLQTYFHIYNIPDLKLEEKSQLLKGTDGIVFVANSEPDSKEQNERALLELTQILEDQNQDILKLPLVFQYNKRDLSPVLPLEILRTQLNKFNCRDFESSVKDGKQVMEPFKHLCKSIVTFVKSGEIQ